MFDSLRVGSFVLRVTNRQTHQQTIQPTAYYGNPGGAVSTPQSGLSDAGKLYRLAKLGGTASQSALVPERRALFLFVGRSVV